jgi:hypothetical protein
MVFEFDFGKVTYAPGGFLCLAPVIALFRHARRRRGYFE